MIPAKDTETLRTRLRRIAERAMLAASDPHAAASVYRAALSDICNVALAADALSAPPQHTKLIADWRQNSDISRSNADNDKLPELHRRQCLGVAQAYQQCADELEAAHSVSAPPQRTEETPRCKGAGNPCGTDTWAAGQECECGNCQAWLAQFRDGPLQQEIASLRQERDEYREALTIIDQRRDELAATIVELRAELATLRQPSRSRCDAGADIPGGGAA